jgi:hypothetical protein
MIFLLLVNVAVAQNATNQTTTFKIPTSLKGVYSFLVSANPVLLIIFGLILIFVSKLAKFVGIVLIIIAVIHLLFLFLK